MSQLCEKRSRRFNNKCLTIVSGLLLHLLLVNCEAPLLTHPLIAMLWGEKSDRENNPGHCGSIFRSLAVWLDL